MGRIAWAVTDEDAVEMVCYFAVRIVCSTGCVDFWKSQVR